MRDAMRDACGMHCETQCTVRNGTDGRTKRPKTCVEIVTCRTTQTSTRSNESRWETPNMSGETTITICGNLTDAPELRFTPGGAAVATFTVASTPRVFDKTTNAYKDGDTLFMRCTVWREYAENVAESLTKGTRVIVQGRLVQRSFETREGEKRTVVELQVDEVGPALRFVTATLARSQHHTQQHDQQHDQQSWGAPGGGMEGDPWATGGAMNDGPGF